MDRAKVDFCIATADSVFKRRLIGILSTAGMACSGSAASIPELLRALRSIQPWLAVIDVNLPPGNIAQAASIIEEDCLAAAIYIGEPGMKLQDQVKAPWPVDAAVLIAVAEAVCLEFVHKKRMREEINRLKRQITERKEIDKAKGLIMDRRMLGEEEAFARLRSYSMKERLRLVEAAERVINNPAIIFSL